MSLILNIDTSTENASICIAADGTPLGSLTNPHQKEHAAWIHIAIQNVCKAAKIELKQLDAIAITAGPGSYTGLRVGMASAKGLCYALDIPLIAVNTLHAMAFSMRLQQADYFCPMIDARRMEVFTAVYGKELEVHLKPCALILNEYDFLPYLNKGTVLFFGNGSKKYKTLQQNKRAAFSETAFSASDLSPLAYQKFTRNDFSPLAYTDPFYIKDFYMPGFSA
ncbi:MAG: tRNA (adenosine(37)-N6)-threonylcarbamoyltransferase complex dimerization subunit type 1 TsaB [Chitinophagaceae bacterium]|nr:tRNA (adenosine(37)-N6)-threonylcarbamoyltransferase complex dimerization subunit type 1 TsaB [Chitinophagaceae bacterium]